VLHAMPPERSGVAGALLNASREVAGLLGITVIGAILRSRQGDALRHGTSQAGSFLAGYHAGLAFTVALVAAGVVVSYVALRGMTAPEPDGLASAALAGDALAPDGDALPGHAQPEYNLPGGALPGGTLPGEAPPADRQEVPAPR
jgi:hypothetical protein